MAEKEVHPRVAAKEAAAAANADLAEKSRTGRANKSRRPKVNRLNQSKRPSKTTKPLNRSTAGKNAAERLTYAERMQKEKRLRPRAGRAIFWPDGRRRGGNDLVLLPTDPFIGDQWGKLRPAPANALPTPITDSRYAKIALDSGYIESGGSVVRKNVRRRKEEPEPEPTKAEDPTGELPDPDEVGDSD